MVVTVTEESNASVLNAMFVTMESEVPECVQSTHYKHFMQTSVDQTCGRHCHLHDK